MANTTLETRLRVKAETEGRENLSAMAGDIKKLADEGGKAAPELRAALEELQKISNAQIRADLLAGAIDSAKAAHAELREARQQVELFNRQLADARGAGAGAEAIKILEGSLKSANQQLKTTEAAWNSANNTLKDARAGAAAAGVDVRNLSAEQQRLAAAADGAAQRLRNLHTATSAGGQSVSGLGQDARGAGQELAGLGNQADGLNTKLKGVAAAIGSVFALAKIKGYAGDAIAVADAYGQMASRIEQATKSGEEYNLVQRRLLETANNTYRPLAEAQEVFIRTSGALRDLGYNTDAALDITDSFSYLLVTNAASAEKAAGAMDAYTKSIQSGTVASLSWRSIMMAMPSVVNAIASATGKTSAEVRQLGSTGKLAVKDLNEGLRQSVELNKELAASMPTTVADAVTSLANAWSAYIGEANMASGTTARIVELIGKVRDNLDTLVGAATKAGNLMMTIFAARALMAVKNYAVQAYAAAKGMDTVTVATARQGAAAATAAPQVAAAAAATAAHGKAAAGAAAGVNVHAGALARQGAAARTGSAAMGLLSRGIMGILRLTGWGLLATAVLSIAEKLLFAKDEAKELEKQLKNTVNAADFSDKTGIEEFIEQLHKAGEFDPEKFGQQFSLRLKRMGDEDVKDLQKKLKEMVEDGGSAEPALVAMLKEAEARLKEIERLANLGKTQSMEEIAKKGKISDLAKEYMELAESGKSAEEALAGIGKAVDLRSTAGIGELLTSFRELQGMMKVTGEQVEKELVRRLADFSAQDLRDFGIQAEMAFNRGEIAAREFSTALNAQTRVALTRLGLDADQVLTGMSAKFAETAGSVDVLLGQVGRLRAAGVDTGEMLTKAFKAALGAAESTREIKHLTQQIEEAARTGKAAKPELENMLKAVRERAKEAGADLRKMNEEVADLLRQAKETRAGTGGVGARAQERRDRGLSDEDRDAAARKRAREALREAELMTAMSTSESFAGRAEEAQRYAERAVKLIEQAAQAADSIKDDDTAVRLLDQIAQAEARALEERARQKEEQSREIADKAKEQTAALDELEKRLADLSEGATTVVVRANTDQADDALDDIRAQIAAIPDVKEVVLRVRTEGEGVAYTDAAGAGIDLAREVRRSGSRR